jgi:hypothetical protein
VGLHFALFYPLAGPCIYRRFVSEADGMDLGSLITVGLLREECWFIIIQPVIGVSGRPTSNLFSNISLFMFTVLNRINGRSSFFKPVGLLHGL